MHIPEILQNRAYLLTVIGLITTVAALGPFFLEKFTPELAAHASLHIAAITFGIFLFILSIIAYNSTRNTNMVFTALAFATFTVLSIFLLEEDLAAERMEHNEAVWVDILLTIMIGFFGIGVFSNQKFPTRRTYD
jgi:succinate-acetate transporter protein